MAGLFEYVIKFSIISAFPVTQKMLDKAVIGQNIKYADMIMITNARVNPIGPYQFDFSIDVDAVFPITDWMIKRTIKNNSATLFYIKSYSITQKRIV